MVLKPEKSNYVCLHSVSDFCHRSVNPHHQLQRQRFIVFAAWHTLGEAFEMLVQHALDIFASAWLEPEPAPLTPAPSSSSSSSLTCSSLFSLLHAAGRIYGKWFASSLFFSTHFTCLPLDKFIFLIQPAGASSLVAPSHDEGVCVCLTFVNKYAPS